MFLLLFFLIQHNKPTGPSHHLSHATESPTTLVFDHLCKYHSFPFLMPYNHFVASSFVILSLLTLLKCLSLTDTGSRPFSRTNQQHGKLTITTATRYHPDLPLQKQAIKPLLFSLLLVSLFDCLFSFFMFVRCSEQFFVSLWC